jgi:hypothetical protein
VRVVVERARIIVDLPDLGVVGNIGAGFHVGDLHDPAEQRRRP